MEPKDARAMLGVTRDCSLAELNKRYRALALRLHPDKNGNSPDATDAFQKLNAAYCILSPNATSESNEANEANEANESTDANMETYSNICMNFIKSLFARKHNSKMDEFNGGNPILLELLHRIVHDCASVSANAILDSLDPSALFRLYEILEQYNATAKPDARVFDEITRIIREKMQKNNIVILKPSLKDVLQNNISVVKVEGHTFYVPLWHSELHYRMEDEDENKNETKNETKNKNKNRNDAHRQLIVRCMPELPDHMSIDSNNELHIDVRADIKELMNRGSGVLRIPLYDYEFVELQVRELHVVSRQTIVLRNNKHGISLICSNNIYDVNDKAPICVHVHFV